MIDKPENNNEVSDLTLQQKWEHIGLSNDFIFGKVMQDPDLCLQLLQRMFPDMVIDHIEYPELQKTFKADMDSHGIRLDVYVRDDFNTVYDIEMQTVNTGDLPKRSRYYQSMIDVSEFDAGKSYTELASNYIIFICMTDPFGEGRHQYVFENRCRANTDLVLADGAQRIFFNAAGVLTDVNEEMERFLAYLSGKKSNDSFIEKLDEAVQKAKHNREWRQEFMTLEMRDRENFVKGKSEGRAEGRAREIVEMGYEFGLTKDAVLSKLQKKLEITSQKAQEYFDQYSKKAV